MTHNSGEEGQPMIVSTQTDTLDSENGSQVEPIENGSQTELHHVTYDAVEDTLVFTCHGDDTAKCHHYPTCECESWAADHEHPYVLHDKCWLQDWFDSLAVSYDHQDTNIDGFGPYEVSGSGFVKAEFDGYDAVLWSWLPVLPVAS